VHSLKCGDTLGYSDLLKIAGPEYLGESRAEAEAEIIWIEHPDQVIQLYERKILQEMCRDSYQEIKEMVERRYPHLVC
jgi:hypothetical protein